MTSRTAVHTFVIRPETPYAAVHSALLNDGWAGGPVTRTRPLLSGEPEVARYRRDEEVATYELDPVAMLRLLRTPAAAPQGLPLLAEVDVLALLDLRGSDIGSQQGLLLGALAAGELGLAKAVPRLRRLGHRRVHPIVLDAAAISLDRIAHDGRSRRLR